MWWVENSNSPEMVHFLPHPPSMGIRRDQGFSVTWRRVLGSWSPTQLHSLTGVWIWVFKPQINHYSEPSMGGCSQGAGPWKVCFGQIITEPRLAIPVALPKWWLLPHSDSSDGTNLNSHRRETQVPNYSGYWYGQFLNRSFKILFVLFFIYMLLYGVKANNISFLIQT